MLRKLGGSRDRRTLVPPLALLVLAALPAGASVLTYRVACRADHAQGMAIARAPRRAAVPYDDLILRYAEEFDVDAALVKAIIRAESGFDARAISPRGARGLMQLMPRTARFHGVADPLDPGENIRAGVRHLRALLDRYGDDPKLAVAAYNAGSGEIARYRGLPPHRETRSYVAKVLRLREKYRQDGLRRF